VNLSCKEAEFVYDFVIGALPGAKARAFSAHLATCRTCDAELARIRSVMAGFTGWPSDILTPSPALWEKLVARIGESGSDEASAARPVLVRRAGWSDVAPGVACKLLATDPVTGRVSMLVRLGAGVDYPSHRHAGVEELHLLHGELVIDDRTLQPGEFYTAGPGSVDTRVWSKTGCTCVLMTSLNDELLGTSA